MKTKDFFRMEYAQILIYIVFLGLLEVLLFIFEVNYFLMIYLLLIGLILEGVYLCQRYMKKYRYYKKVKAKLDILEQKCMITEISFCARCEKNEILLEIRDNGIGISPKDLPRITDKGYTGTTGRNYQKSTGMGLYLCKKLCSKLQLSFYIESKEEEYTKVTIGFPRNSMIFLNEE